jgi:thioredoxin 1
MSSEIEEIRQRKMEEIKRRVGKGTSGVSDWPDVPVQVNDDTFESFVKEYQNVVVDCWAPWCGPCRMLSPTIDTLAKDMRGKVAFAKLNTDDNYGTAGKFRIVSIPTLLFFKDGQLINKMVGAAPKAMVEQEIRKALG